MSPQPSGQPPNLVGPPRPGLRPSSFRPVQALPPPRSPVVTLVLLGVLGLGLFGGYYGYCRYKVNDKIHDLEEEAHEQLHNWLSTRGHDIGPEDLRQFVLDLAVRHQVVLEPDAIQVSIQPYSATSAHKLPGLQRAALDGKYGKVGTADLWVVGFHAEMEVRCGVTRERFASDHYTWFQWVKK